MRADDSTTRLMKTGVATFSMVVVGLLVAPTLSDWHSRQLAERLTVRIAQAEDAEVKVLLRQLADLGDASIEQLIVASASERAAVTAIAQKIIDERMSALVVAAQNGSAGEFVDRARITGTALADHIHEFGPAGKLWAERVTLQLIDISGQLPGRPARVLLDDCSQVLSAIPPRGPRLRTVVQNGVTANQANAQVANEPEPLLDPLTRASEGSLENLSKVGPNQRPAIQQGLTKMPLQAFSSVETHSKRPSADLNWAQRDNSNRDLASAAPAGAARVAQSQIAPEQAHKNKKVLDVPTPQSMEQAVTQLRKLSSEKLLRRLRQANFYEAGAIRAVLGDRGFDDRELALRQQANSPDVRERLRLTEDISQLPAASARRILRLLLTDENADVRLAALTALGTSNAPELAEVARELAERDTDRRVAELAVRLLKQVRR